MKTLRGILLLSPLLLLAMTRLAAAGPADVVTFPRDGSCTFAWGGVDQNGPHVVLVAGRGVLTVTNNSRDNRAIHCDGQINFGELAQVFVPDYQAVATVQLLTSQQVCLVFPDACHGASDQGAVIFNPENAPGFNCTIGDDANGNPVVTNNVTERVTPGGQAQIVCHLP